MVNSRQKYPLLRLSLFCRPVTLFEVKVKTLPYGELTCKPRCLPQPGFYPDNLAWFALLVTSIWICTFHIVRDPSTNSSSFVLIIPHGASPRFAVCRSGNWFKRPAPDTLLRWRFQQGSPQASEKESRLEYPIL